MAVKKKMYSFSGAKNFRITALLLSVTERDILRKAVAIGISLCEAMQDIYRKL